MSVKQWTFTYKSRPIETLGWYADSLPTSQRLVTAYLKRAMGDAAVIDVGAGASVFADQMIADGCVDITLLDLSEDALDVTLKRLSGDEAVTSIVGDVLTTAVLRQHGYDAWHDRAVFHFLTQREDQVTYVQRASQSLHHDGIIVLGTFAPDGPTMCNNLPVSRYGPQDIEEIFTTHFELAHTERQMHITPSDGQQPYNYFVLTKRHRK